MQQHLISAIWGLIAGASLGASVAAAAPATAIDVDIPFRKFVLTNGLTLLVHEDHKAPIVAVNVWYHVGSKNEKPGKTGFAHLFEHLMFNGSEHFNDDYFKATEKVGATDLNGTTSEDRTNYFENAPEDALDYLLWLESDRMGHLLGAIDQAKLDEQRGVVQNEKRQYENQPYGLVNELLAKATFPPGHPYSWTVIGSMADLNAATLDDVKEWFRDYYGTANATLVVAGDVDPETARAKVERYFGPIPSGPPVTRHAAWIARRTGTLRQVAEDRVPQARIYRSWNIPQFGTAEADYLNLASDILSNGKNSRLYKRLVYKDQIATDVSASVDLNEIAGRFFIVATARPGESLEKVERAIDEELAEFLKDGPTRDELQVAKMQNLSAFVRRSERIGGFGGKSDILANYEVFTGDAANFKHTVKRMREATAKDLVSTAREWLSDGDYILEVHPFPAYRTSPDTVDRSKLPVPSIKPEVKFPALQQAKLPNGLKIVLAERHDTPQVTFELLVDAGYAADHLLTPGTAELAMSMLEQGTRKRNVMDIDLELNRLGAEFNTGSTLDSSRASLSTLTSTLESAFEIYADILLNPVFPEKELTRLKTEQLAAIKREKTQPNTMALRILPQLLYGKEHPYSLPFTGSGFEQTVSKLTRDDVMKFYTSWFKPNNATLIVVGDTKMEQIQPIIARYLGEWKSGPVPVKNLATVAQKPQSVLYLLDRPGSLQSIVIAGQLAPPKSDPQDVSIETMNLILGGSFTSRINMNLREEKHWTYGARTTLTPARGQRPLLAVAPVQGDKTAETVRELLGELEGVLGKEPITDQELEKAKTTQTISLPGKWETMAAVRRAIDQQYEFGLPTNYWETYPQQVINLDVKDVAGAAKSVLKTGQLTWVIVGDRTKIEPELRKLSFSEIRLIDTDGNPIK